MDILEKLNKCYTGILYDVMTDLGLKNFTLPKEIRPISQNSKICGKIFTLKGEVTANITKDDSILSWLDFLSQAKEGYVIVCQPNDRTLAHMGELSSETLKYRGIKGYIVDGGCRDVTFIKNIQFPVFCRYYTPNDIAGCWLVKEINQSIQIGEVEINPDDYVLADLDGLVIIPANKANEIIDLAFADISKENQVRKAILTGKDPKQAYLKYGKF